MTDAPVLVLELPLELAPTLNTYANLRSFQRAKIRRRVDQLVVLATILLAKAGAGTHAHKNMCRVAPLLTKTGARVARVDRCGLSIGSNRSHSVSDVGGMIFDMFMII